MSTPELTVKRAKTKLLWAILKFSILILIAAAIGYFAMLQSATTVYTKGDLLQRWLQAEIAQDENLKQTFKGLAGKLVDISGAVEDPGASNLTLKLVTPKEFDAEHKKKPESKTTFVKTEVDLDMGLAVRILKDSKPSPVPVPRPSPTTESPERVRNPEPAKTIDDVDDRERVSFSKGLQGLYSTVDAALREEKRSAGSVDANIYSDILLEKYFGIDKLIKEHYPEIQVLWVYIVSKDTRTVAFYPAPNSSLQIPLDDRPWFSASIGDDTEKRYTGVGAPRPQLGEKVVDNPDIALSPFYGDFVSGGPVRTLWHRFEVPKPGGGSSQYVVCVDLIMRSPTSPGITPGLLENSLSNDSVLGRLSNSVIFGLILSVSFALLGATFVRFGGSLSEAAARRYISGEPNPEVSSSGYVVEPIEKVYLQYSEQADQDSSTKRGDRKKSRLNIEFEHQEGTGRSSDVRRLTIHPEEKWKIRGKERWEVYTRQLQSGTCRLCDQEIAHYGEEQRIGSVVLIHRMNHEPEVDFQRKPRGPVVGNTKFIEDNMQWHALNPVDEGLESGTQRLELYPTPRVPQQFSDYNFIEDLLIKYRRLNEGRYMAREELLHVSEVMLPTGSVQSVYRVSYMRKLLSDQRGKELLKLGRNIKRFLVASTDEELSQFLNEHRAAVVDLAASQKLLFAILRGTALAELDSYKELNFSQLTLSDNSEVVIVAQPESINSGYVSWREADLSYYIALFKQIEDIGARLPLDENG